MSYESGFVLSSSAQQREVVAEVTDDPMLQQIQIITGYIAQARQQNRYLACYPFLDKLLILSGSSRMGNLCFVSLILPVCLFGEMLSRFIFLADLEHWI